MKTTKAEQQEVDSPLQSSHTVIVGDARFMNDVASASVQLIVTSPPYPMIEMWDDLFSSMDSNVRHCLDKGDGAVAFERMHALLDQVWRECFRVLVPGGFLCVNIGDAVRTLLTSFQLYSNHTRIITECLKIGFKTLPDILWRKPTNAPNKFMGSGMLPAGAYVTYEHEYILIFRKGEKRPFESHSAKKNRMASAYFWEERNSWFSDVWSGVVGSRQAITDKETRKRSAAFPVEVPYRLILMFSVHGDVVLDPFLGTGSTSIAALTAGRSSIGIELDEKLAVKARKTIFDSLPWAVQRAATRLMEHQVFVADRIAKGKAIKNVHDSYGFPIITTQEKSLAILEPVDIAQQLDGTMIVTHQRAELPPEFGPDELPFESIEPKTPS